MNFHKKNIGSLKHLLLGTLFVLISFPNVLLGERVRLSLSAAARAKFVGNKCVGRLTRLIRAHLQLPEAGPDIVLAVTEPHPNPLIQSLTSVGVAPSHAQEIVTRITMTTDAHPEDPVIQPLAQMLLSSDGNQFVCLVPEGCLSQTPTSGYRGIHFSAEDHSEFGFGLLKYRTYPDPDFIEGTPGISFISLGGHTEPEGRVELAASFMHEQTHAADFEKLRQWLSANLVLIAADKQPDALFRQYVIVTNHGYWVPHSFIQMFTESRAFYATALTQIRNRTFPDPRAAMLDYQRIYHGLFRSILASYKADPKKIGLGGMLSEKTFFEIGLNWGAQIEETIARVRSDVPELFLPTNSPLQIATTEASIRKMPMVQKYINRGVTPEPSPKSRESLLRNMEHLDRIGGQTWASLANVCKEIREPIGDLDARSEGSDYVQRRLHALMNAPVSDLPTIVDAAKTILELLSEEAPVANAITKSKFQTWLDQKLGQEREYILEQMNLNSRYEQFSLIFTPGSAEASTGAIAVLIDQSYSTKNPQKFRAASEFLDENYLKPVHEMYRNRKAALVQLLEQALVESPDLIAWAKTRIDELLPDDPP